MAPTTLQTVVVLHGLGRTARSMQSLERSLRSRGFRTVCETYPSRSAHPEDLAARCLARHATGIAEGTTHLVTHSMGGILVRIFGQSHPISDQTRIVMLAPPNQGSEVVDRLSSFPPFGWYTGVAGKYLHTGRDSIPNSLPAIQGQIGIIAGSKSSDPWFNWMFNSDHDGKVSVPSTRLPEMQDHLVVPKGHTFLMRDPSVHAAVLRFLHTGSF